MADPCLVVSDGRVALVAALRDQGMSAATAASKAQRLGHLRDVLAARAPRKPVWGWFVPGRIELLGKHTDYAGGRSLLCAVERGFCVVAAPRADGRVRILDAGWDAELDLPLEGGPAPSGWGVYPATMLRRLRRDFPELRQGADIVLSSDLPRSAGMSSSSALMTACYFAMAGANQLESLPRFQANITSREDLAGYLAAVESGAGWRDFPGDAGVGTHGGSEDHTAILCCRAGFWSRYAFCPVREEGRLAAPQEFVLAIGASGVVASKTGGARGSYNRAVEITRALLHLWNSSAPDAAATLGEVLARPGAARELFDRCAAVSADGVSAADLRARLRQFEQESFTIIPAVDQALARADWTAFGALVARSQQGAEDGLRNQVPETIALVRMAREHGAVAASAFGAGFGGSVWALVPKHEAAGFVPRWRACYQHAFADRAAQSVFFVSGAGPGAFAVPCES
ncbi:MAG TPA: galactokinase family protein [Terriglobales bacterium]|nr:galactokinase family protein [Terriglobales bacterium]